MNWDNLLNEVFTMNLREQGSYVITVYKKDTTAFLAIKGLEIVEVPTLLQASKFAPGSTFVSIFAEKCNEYMYYLQKKGIYASFGTLFHKGLKSDAFLAGFDFGLKPSLVEGMIKSYIESFVEKNGVKADASECYVISVCKPDSTVVYLAVVGNSFVEVPTIGQASRFRFKGLFASTLLGNSSLRYSNYIKELGLDILLNVQIVCCDCCEEGTLFDESGYDFTSVDMMLKSYLNSLVEEPSRIFLYVDYADDYKNKWEKSNCTLEEFMNSHSHCVVLQVIECK